MATENTPTEQSDQASEPQTAEQTAPVINDGFDWDAMEAPKPMPTKLAASAVKVDVLTTIPEPIRKLAEASLTINTAKVAAKAGSAASRPRVDYHWDVQPVRDDKMGDAFVAYIVKYAKHRPTADAIPHADDKSPKGQVTARHGATTRFRMVDGIPVAVPADFNGESFLGVRYSVRPFEQGKDTAKLPGA